MTVLVQHSKGKASTLEAQELEMQRGVPLVQPGLPVHTRPHAIVCLDYIGKLKASSQAEGPVEWAGPPPGGL